MVTKYQDGSGQGIEFEYKTKKNVKSMRLYLNLNILI